MFGLEDQSNKGEKPFVFDLEEDLKTAKAKQSHLEHIQSQIQKTKKMLREGKNQAEFDKLGAILYGYTSLMKVVSRIE